MKYLNYIIFFLLLTTAVVFKDHIHISTNLLSLFAPKETIDKLSIADKLGYSKTMLIAVKGFDQPSRDKVTEISKQLQMLQDVVLVQSSVIPSDAMMAYYKSEYALLSTFDNKTLTQVDVQNRLKTLYDAQFTNIFYSGIDKNDPLKLFDLKTNKTPTVSHKDGLITLGDYGYLIRIDTNISPSQMQEATVLYTHVESILSKYPDVVSFAPFYYTVENSKKIQNDVQLISILSTIILLLVYFFLIRNIKLLLHTLMALFSSMLFAGLVSTAVFSNFNVLSLAFGVSISSISIDYLLHYYVHNFYTNNKKVDTNVLYGFLTTVAAFGVFTFIPIPVISQISFFAVLSFSFSYLLFTFVFPKMELKEYKEITPEKKVHGFLPSYIIFLMSVLLFGYSLFFAKFDSNIRNLDYQNTKLQNIENFFATASTMKLHPVIVQANSKESLIKDLHILDNSMTNTFSLASFVLDQDECTQKREVLRRYDFNKLNNFINQDAFSIGFKKDYFIDAYSFAKTTPTCKTPDLDIFKLYGLYMYAEKGHYYTMAFVDNPNQAQKFPFVTNLDIKEMFYKVVNKMYGELIFYALVGVFIIVILLFASVKKRFLYALNYILFPSSFTLAILATFYNINIMHIFSLIILVAVGIDYGIYMSNTNNQHNTMLAIKYSLFTTFAAFGVLAFSSITALTSIGMVISIGTFSIYSLIRVMK